MLILFYRPLLVQINRFLSHSRKRFIPYKTNRSESIMGKTMPDVVELLPVSSLTQDWGKRRLGQKTNGPQQAARSQRRNTGERLKQQNSDTTAVLMVNCLTSRQNNSLGELLMTSYFCPLTETIWTGGNFISRNGIHYGSKSREFYRPSHKHLHQNS